MNADCQDAIESMKIREICVTTLGQLGQPYLPQSYELFDIQNHSASALVWFPTQLGQALGFSALC